MKCPYAVNRIRRIDIEITYNKENIETNSVTNEYNKAQFCDCLKENCGAFDTVKNRCNYRGD